MSKGALNSKTSGSDTLLVKRNLFSRAYPSKSILMRVLPWSENQDVERVLSSIYS